MDVLLSLLGANLKLHEHAARVLEKARSRQQAPRGKALAFDEQAFVRADLALREAEIRELALLHQTVLLAQALKREAKARQQEQKLTQSFEAQEAGSGKQGVLLSQEALQKQEKSLSKDHHNVAKHAEEVVNLFLAEHEAMVRAAALFQAFNPDLILLQPQADAAILKTFASAENNTQRLHELALEEAQGERPRKLAAALEGQRGKMRQHTTRLSNARRHFASLVYQHIPVGSTL